MTLVAIYYKNPWIPVVQNTRSKEKFIECCETLPTDWAHLMNQEAVRDHKVLWKQYHIDNDFKTKENVDDYMNGLIYGWIVAKFYRFYQGA
jgi:hypothetical protein